MPLLQVENLKTWFPVKKSFFGKPRYLKAVDGVSFELKKGETLGLVGESGCGKSTLGRSLLLLEKPREGKVLLDGVDICGLRGKELRQARRRFQMIFQDPYGSLNPRMTVRRMLDEVLALHSERKRAERFRRSCELLGMVGLNSEYLDRYPHQFSGGQRQRIGIARALAVEPEMIVADEPVSALDVSVQAQIINLLGKIQDRTGISFLFIAHDLAVVKHISDRIIVMYLGRIVESGTSADVCDNPAHPYTRALLSAVPVPDPNSRRKRIILPGDVPSPVAPPPGCPFHPRCPLARERCRIETPELKNPGLGKGRLSACFFPEDIPEMDS